MKILKKGHKYQLKNFETDTELNGQIIQFIEKIPANDGSADLETVNDGTTNEDVMEMLLDRLQYLNEKHPCRENALAITKLEESLMWLERRTKNRIKRDVEGKNIT